jgi:hypothetical protein
MGIGMSLVRGDGQGETAAMSSYTVTLNHVRYGRRKFDLAELRRRLERRIAAADGAATTGRLLTHTSRLMTLIDALDRRANDRALKKTLDAEFALLLLDFEQVLAVISGAGGEKPKKIGMQRELAAPKRKPPR